MNIKLSPKHGINPSLEVCFYCGKEIGVALLGRLPNDEEAPRKVCTSYEPCEECKESFEDNIILLECNPPDKPTGKYWLVTKDSIKHQGRKIFFIETEFARKSGLPMEIH